MTKYELKEQIGVGGMGEVYRGEIKGTGGFAREVAIKKLRPELSNDPRFAEMFLQEARIASQLRHNNIVPVLDCCRDDKGALLLVMELIDGVDLSRLSKSGQLPFGVVIYIVTEVLHGLAHAHDLKGSDGRSLVLVHRDVTPRNVMIRWDGSVMVADFGVAKAYATGDSGNSSLRGTLPYTSPEHLQSFPLDRRSDLFAVGVILYKLLTGELPFGGDHQWALFLAVLNGSIRPPRELRPDIPIDLEELAMRLLSPDREARPADAHEVIDALAACKHATVRARGELASILRDRFAAQSSPPAEQPLGHQSTPRQAPEPEEQPNGEQLSAAAGAAPAKKRRITKSQTNRPQPAPFPPDMPPVMQAFAQDLAVAAERRRREQSEVEQAGPQPAPLGEHDSEEQNQAAAAPPASPHAQAAEPEHHEQSDMRDAGAQLAQSQSHAPASEPARAGAQPSAPEHRQPSSAPDVGVESVERQAPIPELAHAGATPGGAKSPSSPVRPEAEARPHRGVDVSQSAVQSGRVRRPRRVQSTAALATLAAALMLSLALNTYLLLSPTTSGDPVTDRSAQKEIPAAQTIPDPDSTPTAVYDSPGIVAYETTRVAEVSDHGPAKPTPNNQPLRETRKSTPQPRPAALDTDVLDHRVTTSAVLELW